MSVRNGELYHAIKSALEATGNGFISSDSTLYRAIEERVAPLLAKSAPALLDINTPMPDQFREYVEDNYPPGVVIGNPTWHAPKLWGAAVRAMRAAMTPEVDRG